MSFKHSVSCGRCGVESIDVNYVEGRWRPPHGWLSISYDMVGEKDGCRGIYLVFENRHACPDCAQGVIGALGKVTGPADK